MTSNVKALRETHADGEEIPLPGFDIGIMANVGEQSQLQMKTMVAQDTPDAVVNHILDRMQGFADRLAAKGQILAHQAERTKFLDELSHMDADAAESERVYLLAKAKAEEGIAECGRKAEDYEAQGRADWEKRGRTGDYVPAGAVKDHIKRAHEAKAGYAASIQRLDEERKQALDQFTIAYRRREERVKFLDAEIERLGKLIG